MRKRKNAKHMHSVTLLIVKSEDNAKIVFFWAIDCHLKDKLF